MKSYSDSSVTKSDVQTIASQAAEQAGTMARMDAYIATDAVDKKQDRQINQTRWALAAVFVTNLIISIVLVLNGVPFLK